MIFFFKLVILLGCMKNGEIYEKLIIIKSEVIILNRYEGDIIWIYMINSLGLV